MPQPRTQKVYVIPDDEGQEGNRWIGVRPTPDQFGAWWNENVFIHDELKDQTAKYAGGVVLIEQKPRFRRTVVDEATGNRKIVDMERLEYTPYAKVDTRVVYFWDLCEVKGWLGVIEMLAAPRSEAVGYNNMHLPAGFYRHQVNHVAKVGNGEAWTQYIGCQMRVRVYDPDHTRIEVVEDKITGEPKQIYIGRMLIDAPPATKLVPALQYPDNPDDYAPMKAETGAVGRALGMAGILVIPGSGIATAEDVQEALEATASGRPAAPDTAALVAPGQGSTPPGDTPPTEPPPPPANATELEQATEDQLRTAVKQKALELKAANAAKFEELKAIFVERKWGELTSPTIDSIQPMFLRGLVKKIDVLLAEARAEETATKVQASAEKVAAADKPEPAEAEDATPKDTAPPEAPADPAEPVAEED